MGFHIRRFFSRRDGNVAIVVALCALPMLMVTAMGVDYGMAADRQIKLNAFADAAALASVTPTMMAGTTTAAVTAAQNTFNAQASTLSNVSYSPSNLTVTISTTGALRTTTVAYKTTYSMMFPHVFGASTITLQGSSTANAGMAPNIDFYLLLDSSPSMAIAATQADITTMVNNTSSQGGCAFACHETNPAVDNLGNAKNVTCTTGTKSFPSGGEDNYALARCLGVTLRIDLLNQAAQNLMSAATTKEEQYNANAQSTTASTSCLKASQTTGCYRMGIYSFDVNFNAIQALTANLATATTSAANVSMLTVYANNYLTSSNQNSDADTNYDNAMKNITAVMPNPGSGTTATGDTPQEVLFFVTDGVEDESVSGGRQQSLMNNSYCTTLKNKGIRIAVLYTEYLPLPTNSWYDTYIQGFQANIGTTPQSCASPGLYYEVQTGGDISGALTSLFQLAVQSAYLSK